ncbi:hypothetical protein [Glaciecola sp. 1036]|uniref:hypothetical protein n=1 Tax=Alteromonadaceae TaxID=72275 RepID=UPI003D0796B7
MTTKLPQSIKVLFDQVRVTRFWWDGVQINIPMHTVYAVIPNPVSAYRTKISGVEVPVMSLGGYNVPVWDPMHKGLTKMPKFAVVIIHQENEKFGLYAYPADCMDESFTVSYDEWFERQKTS